MQSHKTEILADSRRSALRSPRLAFLAGIVSTSLLGVVAATAVVPGTMPEQAFAPERVLEKLPLPKLEVLEGEALPFVREERIRPGDTLQSLFKRMGIIDAEALAYVSNSDEGKAALRKLRAGRSVTAIVTATGEIVSLNIPIAATTARFTVERKESGLQGISSDVLAAETMIELRSGVITHALFGATDSAGVPDRIASKFADLFGTEIDFSRDIREGDSFAVVYEVLFDNGVQVDTGRILAAEFVNQGKTHTVVLHREQSGDEAYYKPDGTGLNQAFLRYPLEFSRVSSNFGRRLHPIHRSWRAHNGTDFAAPTGTPVKASSDGRVDFVGDQRGYGKTVIIDHRDRYSTLYAHMSGFASGLTKGQRVRQGDVIGYVGSTGWATGPHLHYEVRINDVPHDPMQIVLPEVRPLEGKALAAFRSATTPALEKLALLNNRGDEKVAKAD